MEWSFLSLPSEALLDCGLYGQTTFSLPHQQPQIASGNSGEEQLNLFVFGGLDSDKNYINDVVRLYQKNNSLNYEIVQVKSKETPSPRAFHTLTEIPQTLSKNAPTTPRPNPSPTSTTTTSSATNNEKTRRGSKLGSLTARLQEQEQEESEARLGSSSASAAKTINEEDESMVLLSRYICFGGKDGRQYYNDLWILSMFWNQSTSKYFCSWKQVLFDSSEKQPEPRAEHTACFVEKLDQQCLYIFGGFNTSKTLSKALSDMWALDTESFSWSCIDETSADRPVARFGHSAVAVNYATFQKKASSKEYKIILSYGYNDHGVFQGKTPLIAGLAPKLLGNNPVISPIVSNYLNDCWSFDVNTATWSKLRFNVNVEARYQHSCIYIGNGCLFVFGGYYTSDYRNDAFVMDLASQRIIPVPCVKNLQTWPSARRGMSMAHQKESSRILMLGGKLRKSILGDVCILNSEHLMRVINVGSVESEKKQLFTADTIAKPGLKKSSEHILAQISRYSSKLQSNPKDIKYLNKRASLYIELRMHEKALQDAQVALDTDPQGQEQQVHALECYFLGKQHEKVVTYAKQLIAAKTLEKKKAKPSKEVIVSEKTYIMNLYLYKAKSLLETRKEAEAAETVDVLLSFFGTEKKESQDTPEHIYLAVQAYRIKVESKLKLKQFSAVYEVLEKFKEMIKQELALEKLLNINLNLIAKINQTIQNDETVTVKQYLKLTLDDIKSKESEVRRLEADYLESKRYFKLGKAKYAEQKVEEAIALLIKSNIYDPSNYRALAETARCFHALRQFDTSIHYAGKCLQLKSDYVDAHVIIAQCNIGKRKLTAGIALLEKMAAVADISPEQSEEISSLISAAKQRKRDLEEALSLGGKAKLLLDQSAYSEALDVFCEAIKLDDENKDLFVDRAKVYRYLKMHDKALVDLKKAISIDPDVETGYIEAISLLLELGLYSKASSMAEAAFKRNLGGKIQQLRDKTKEYMQKKQKAELEKLLLLEKCKQLIVWENVTEMQPTPLEHYHLIVRGFAVPLKSILQELNDVIEKLLPIKGLLLLRAQIEFLLQRHERCLKDVNLVLAEFDKDDLIAAIEQSGRNRKQVSFSYRYEAVCLGMKALSCLGRFEQAIAFQEKYKKCEWRDVVAQQEDIEALSALQAKIKKISEFTTSYNRELTAAKQFIQSGQAEKSVDSFLKAIQLGKSMFPKSILLANTMFECAEVMLSLQKFSDCKSLIESAIQIWPAPHFFTLLASSKALQGDLKGAIETCANGLIEFPYNSTLDILWEKTRALESKRQAEQLLSQARSLLLSNQATGALQLVNSALLHVPSSVVALFMRASIHLSLGKTQQAIQDTEYLIALVAVAKQSLPDPSKLNVVHAQLHCLLGQAFFALRELDQAKKHFNKGLKLNPQDQLIKKENSLLLESEKTIREAITVSKAAAAFATSVADNISLEKAIAGYSKAILLDPMSARYFLERAKIYYATSRVELALDDLEKALQRGGVDAESFMLKITCLVETGDYSSANTVLSQALLRVQDNEKLLEMKEEILQRERNFAQASEKFKQAEILNQENKLEEALEFYVQAKNLAPMHATFSIGHIECLLKLNKTAEALYHIDTLISVHPHQSQAHALKLRLFMDNKKDYFESILLIIESIERKTRSKDMIDSLYRLMRSLSEETDKIKPNKISFERKMDKEIVGLLVPHGMAPEIQTLDLAELLSESELELLKDISLTPTPTSKGKIDPFPENKAPAENDQPSTPQVPTSPTNNIIASAFQATSAFLKEFAHAAMNIMIEQKEKVYYYTLRAFAVANKQLSEEQLLLLAIVLKIDNKQAKSINQKLFADFTLPTYAISMVRDIVEQVEQNKHSFYKKAHFPTEKYYFDWKSSTLKKCNEVLNQFKSSLSTHKLPPEGSMPKPKHEKMFVQLVDALIAERPTHIIAESTFDIIVTVAEVCGLGKVYALLTILCKCATRMLTASAEPFDIFKTMTHLIRAIIERSNYMGNTSSVNENILLFSESSSGIYLSEGELSLLNSSLKQIQTSLTTIFDYHYRIINQSDSQKVVSYALKVMAAVRILTAFSNFDTDTTNISVTGANFRSTVQQLFTENHDNLFNLLKDEIVQQATAVDCSYLTLLSRALQEYLDLYQVNFEQELPASLNILPLTAKYLYGLIASELENQAKAAQSILDLVETNQSTKITLLRQELIFQVPDQVKALYKRITKICPSVEDLDFQIERMILPFIFLILREYEHKMMAWAARAVELDTWTPLNKVESTTFTTSVVDIFSALSQILHFIMSMTDIVFTNRSKTVTHSEDDEELDETDTSYLEIKKSYSISNLRLIYLTYSDILKNIVQFYASLVEKAFNAEISLLKTKLGATQSADLPAKQLEKITLCWSNLEVTVLKIHDIIQDVSSTGGNDLDNDMHSMRMIIENIGELIRSLNTEYLDRMIASFNSLVLNKQITDALKQLFDEKVVSKDLILPKLFTQLDSQIAQMPLLKSSKLLLPRFAKDILNTVTDGIKQRLLSSALPVFEKTKNGEERIQTALFKFFEPKGIDKSILNSETSFLSSLFKLAGRSTLSLAEQFNNLTSHIAYVNRQTRSRRISRVDSNASLSSIIDDESIIDEDELSASVTSLTLEDSVVTRNYIYALIHFRSLKGDKYAQEVVEIEKMSLKVETRKREAQQKIKQEALKELHEEYVALVDEIKNLEDETKTMFEEYYMLKTIRKNNKARRHTKQANNELQTKILETSEKIAQLQNSTVSTSEQFTKELRTLQAQQLANISFATEGAISPQQVFVEKVLKNSLQLSTSSYKIVMLVACLCELVPGFLVAIQLNKRELIFWVPCHDLVQEPKKQDIIVMDVEIVESIGPCLFGETLDNAICIHFSDSAAPQSAGTKPVLSPRTPANNVATTGLAPSSTNLPSSQTWILTSFQDRDLVMKNLVQFVANAKQVEDTKSLLSFSTFNFFKRKPQISTANPTTNPSKPTAKGFVVSEALRKKYALQPTDRLLNKFACSESESRMPGDLLLFTSKVCFEAATSSVLQSQNSITNIILDFDDVVKITKMDSEVAALKLTEKTGRSHVFHIVGQQKQRDTLFGALCEAIVKPAEATTENSKAAASSSSISSKPPQITLKQDGQIAVIKRHHAHKKKKGTTRAIFEAPFKVGTKVFQLIGEGGEEMKKLAEQSNERMRKFISPAAKKK